jgi:hypothetical protein
LLEPQRTNLVLRSEEFDNASWGKINATITANATASPSGVINADKIVESNTTTFHGIIINITTFLKNQRNSAIIFLMSYPAIRYISIKSDRVWNAVGVYKGCYYFLSYIFK